MRLCLGSYFCLFVIKSHTVLFLYIIKVELMTRTKGINLERINAIEVAELVPEKLSSRKVPPLPSRTSRLLEAPPPVASPLVPD
mmetsp:Transcript_2383/g.4403  ORF Transcript_2383/g.4403 Transcript_2383/m.4403 type:complete len:84 (-) Transcript_2383:44-295(-)